MCRPLWSRGGAEFLPWGRGQMDVVSRQPCVASIAQTRLQLLGGESLNPVWKHDKQACSLKAHCRQSPVASQGTTRPGVSAHFCGYRVGAALSRCCVSERTEAWGRPVLPQRSPAPGKRPIPLRLLGVFPCISEKTRSPP